MRPLWLCNVSSMYIDNVKLIQVYFVWMFAYHTLKISVLLSVYVLKSLVITLHTTSVGTLPMKYQQHFQ